MQSLFPYQSYQPYPTNPRGTNSWDRYYPAEPAAVLGSKEPDASTVSSGLAAGITIAIFFLVFIFTFGCRIYSEYVDRAGHGQSSSRSSEPVITESMAADFWICGVPRSPPPPYEVAILMPATLYALPPPLLSSPSTGGESCERSA